MFPQVLSLSAVSSGVLDMTTDFAPLLTSMVVGLCLCVLGLTFAIGVHDIREAQRKAEHPAAEPGSLPKAA
jgi:hypothetical protein